MLFFHNEGLIDLMAVRTMGASVKLPGSFGRFGTGLNYAIATILRGGGAIFLNRDGVTHHFTTQKQEIRGEFFDLVCLDGEPMGFTTRLGRDWEPWMVLRELGCNARDEGGDFDSDTQGRTAADFVSPGMTVIAVEWSALDQAWERRADLFAEGEPLFANERLRILPGRSNCLFYRGVRVFNLEKPSAYRYDLLEEQSLTEDRTLYGDWAASQLIRSTLLEADNAELLEGVLLAGGGLWEGGLNFEEIAKYKEPSRAFLDVVIAAREARNGALNQSAKNVLIAQMRKPSEDGYSYGGGYRRAVNDRFSYSIEVLESLGIEFDEKQEFLTVEELSGDSLSLVERGIVFVHRKLLAEPVPVIALELLKRWADVQRLYSAEAAVDAIGPLLLKQHKQMADAMALIEEDAKAAAEAEPEPETEITEADIPF